MSHISPTDDDGKKLYLSNSKAKHAILASLSQSEHVKVMHCKFAYKMWEKLNQYHEGDDKVKQEKLLTSRMRFESLNMTENETIAEYFLRVDEVVNMTRGLGEEFKEELITQKLLWSLPMRFNAKILAIEEMVNLNNLNMDQLHGTLIAYDMRVGMEKSEPKEAPFRVSNKGKEHKVHQDYSSSEFDQDLAQLAKKMKRGSGKYKGKFPSKCFDCGRVGHFSSKFPYKEGAEREGLKFRNKSQTFQKKKPYKKKGFYSKEYSSNPESDCKDSSENESNEYLLMALETNSKKQGLMESEKEEEEGVVDLKGEHISALDELNKARKKNKQLK